MQESTLQIQVGYLLIDIVSVLLMPCAWASTEWDTVINVLEKAGWFSTPRYRGKRDNSLTLYVQAMQHQLHNQVGKLELKFSKVAQAHGLLKEGVKRRRKTSLEIRILIEEETNAHFRK